MTERAASISATALVVTVITFITIIFGELVPKRIGQLYPETVARWMSRPMHWLAIGAKPFVKLLSATTQAVLKLLRIDRRGAQHDRRGNPRQPGGGRGRRRDRAARAPDGAERVPPRRPAADLADGAARRHRLAGRHASAVAQCLQQVGAAGERGAHSWYPVCRGSLDDVVGVISVGKLLALGPGRRTDRGACAAGGLRARDALGHGAAGAVPRSVRGAWCSWSTSTAWCRA